MSGKIIDVTVSDVVEVEDGVTAELIGPNGLEAVSHQASTGFARGSKLLENGDVLYGGTGRSSQGRDGEVGVVRIAAKLLFLGSKCEVEGVKIEASDADVQIKLDGTVVELVQVVRAPIGPEFRAKLAQNRLAIKDDALPARLNAREEILKALRAKTDKYTAEQRAKLVLVIDVTDLGCLGSSAVLDSVRDSSDVLSAGFSRILVADTLTGQACILL